MPQFKFEGPDGKQHTIEGPEGATEREAFQHLQAQLGGGQKAAPQDDYRSKLSAALDTATKALAPSWSHNDKSYSPYKPAQPGRMPDDAVNPVGNDAQMVTALGAAQAAGGVAGGLGAARAAGAAAPAVAKATAPPSFGAQMAQNVGRQIPAAAAAGPEGVGNVLQTSLLQSALQHGAGLLGHAAGGPLGGMAAKAVASKLFGG